MLQFDSEKEIESALIRIGNRLLYDKALPMGRKYKTEPKRAYAGIRFVLDAARKQEMLEAFQDGSDRSGENAAIELTGEWVESIAKEIENDILTGHKYNLCPVYADILRQAEMSSGTATNIPRFEATIDKMDKLLRFDVKMKLHAVGTDDDGSHFDISWSTSALLHLKIDLNKGCYTPEFLNNGMMAVKVDSFTMVTKDGPVQLTSTRSYQAPIGKPMLNLCDPNPVLLIPFNIALMPKEKLSGAGHTRQGLLFGGFLGGVTSLNDLNTRETNEATGRNGAGPATPDDDSPNPGAKAQMAATQALLEAHQNDPAWSMSDQGKAAIAALQQQAMDMVRPKVAQLNNAAGNAHSVTDMAAALQSAQLKWTNGNVAPAHDTFRVNKDTIHLTLDVDVRHQPQ